MLELEDKIDILKNYLFINKNTYADSFKTDVLLYFNNFEDMENTDVKFLDKLNCIEDIHNWVDSLTSIIVMKFNEDEDQLSDFIFYTLNS